MPHTFIGHTKPYMVPQQAQASGSVSCATTQGIYTSRLTAHPNNPATSLSDSPVLQCETSAK
jgi:hypothetical protein